MALEVTLGLTASKHNRICVWILFLKPQPSTVSPQPHPRSQSLQFTLGHFTNSNLTGSFLVELYKQVLNLAVCWLFFVPSCVAGWS